MSDLQVVISEPLTVQGSLKETTTTSYAVVSNPKQKDDSKQNKDIVKYGIIAGCSVAGLIIVGGAVGMTVMYRSKATRRERQKSQMILALESGSYPSSQLDLPEHS